MSAEPLVVASELTEAGPLVGTVRLPKQLIIAHRFGLGRADHAFVERVLMREG